MTDAIRHPFQFMDRKSVNLSDTKKLVKIDKFRTSKSQHILAKNRGRISLFCLGWWPLHGTSSENDPKREHDIQIRGLLQYKNDTETFLMCRLLKLHMRHTKSCVSYKDETTRKKHVDIHFFTHPEVIQNAANCGPSSPFNLAQWPYGRGCWVLLPPKYLA